ACLFFFFPAEDGIRDFHVTGVQTCALPIFQTEASLFYHRINNQINSVNVGTGTTVSQIYTYRNLPKAVNKGAEFSVSYQATPDLQLSVGYQYLIAKDLGVLDSIRAGRYP